MDNSNQESSSTILGKQPVSPLAEQPVNQSNQSKKLLIVLAVTITLIILGVGIYILNNQSQPTTNSNVSLLPSPTSVTRNIPSPVVATTTPRLVVFMRKGEIWIKDFSTNQERKLSKTPKVGSPELSPTGKHVYYFQIVNAGEGFPRYNIYIADTQGINEKTFTMGANHYASKLKWSSDGNHLGMVLFANDIPGGSQYYEEVFIYDTNTQRELSLGKLTKGTSEGDGYIVNTSCDKLQLQYVTFCKKYISYIAVPRKNEYKGGYKSEEYSKSKYTKPNYKLTRSEKLDNGLVVLEYYTGESQNPESKWGIGGGNFVPGYDKGVTETYTILLDETTGTIIQEVPLAIDSNFIFY